MSLKKKLTIAELKNEAKAFCEYQSTLNHIELYGVTDGKAVGTYVEHRFKEMLRQKYNVKIGSSAKGIDLPESKINTDIKVTSIRQPQSSCPFKNARQKIFGLGYGLLVFVYHKEDLENGACKLNFINCAYIEKYRTADYTLTKRIIEMKKDGANKEDIMAYLQDRNVPGDEIVYSDLADDILNNTVEQGYLTISNALQWRLQYSRVISLKNQVSGVTNYDWDE